MRVFLSCASLVLLSCGDPVKSDLIAAVPADSERNGPLHHAGQPCGVCHDGSTAQEFSVAGTVYLTQGMPDPAPGVTVEIQDLAGKVQCSAVTNSVGNFYLHTTTCVPAAPYKPVLVSPDPTLDPVPMNTRVGRTTSCATCHKGTTATTDSVEGIFLQAGGT